MDLPQNFHYVEAWVTCDVNDEPENLEPDKCDGWSWRIWDGCDFPVAAELFTGLRIIRQSDFDPFIEK